MMRKNGILAAVCSLVFVALCSACGGTGQEGILIGQQGTEDFGLIQASSPEPVPSAEAPGQEICVYVCGAVKTPGIVFLPQGSRAADALEAAGGFAAGAAEDAVNLAAKVSDGEKLYFPAFEEHAAQTKQEETAAAGLVNINTADAAQLCTLPGIGESRAADIIAYRESHGGFAACGDIMKVTGIKESVYNRISGKITVE